MKQRLKIVSVAMLGLGITGILLAGISAHAELMSKKVAIEQIQRWDGEKP